MRKFISRKEQNCTCYPQARESFVAVCVRGEARALFPGCAPGLDDIDLPCCADGEEVIAPGAADRSLPVVLLLYNHI